MAQDAASKHWDTPPDGDFVRYVEALSAAAAVRSAQAMALQSAQIHSGSSGSGRAAARARTPVASAQATQVQPAAAGVKGSGRQRAAPPADAPGGQPPDLADLKDTVWQALRTAGVRRVVRMALLVVIALLVVLGKGSAGTLMVMGSAWWALGVVKGRKKTP